MASGKLRKDKAGNWEFEYDSPESSGSGAEDTIQSSSAERPNMAAVAQGAAASSSSQQAANESDTLNLVCCARAVCLRAARSLVRLQVLRVRNQQRELNDIKFDYTPKTDTVDGIAHELVTAELIDGLFGCLQAAKVERAQQILVKLDAK